MKLRQAIIDHAHAYEIAEPTEFLGDYMIIGAWTPMEGEGRRTVYTAQYPGMTQPYHIAFGLLRTADKLLQETMAEDDGGD